MPKPNLYLINGPLGAGKTTFLQYLLSRPEFANARVIENEFASTSIDTQALHDHTAEVQTIAGVCICCSTGDELIEALTSLAASREPVVIEATGVANSLQLVEKLILGDMLEHYTLAHAIFVLDGAEANDEQLEAYADELRAADTVLVSKLDLIDDARVDWLHGALAERGVSRVLAVDNGAVDLAFLAESSRIVSFAAEYDGDIRAHDDSVNYTVLAVPKLLDAVKLSDAWPWLRDTYDLSRMKGDIIDGTGVYWHVEATPAQCRITKGDTAPLQLVFIGAKARQLTVHNLLEYVS